MFDHNGWKEGVAPATIYNHNLYITNGTTGISLIRNIISDASSHGIQLRSGGEIRENFCTRTPSASCWAAETRSMSAARAGQSSTTSF